jgi:D-aspartate ligase
MNSMAAKMAANKALAIVLGDMDLVRSLGLAGIACVAVAQPGDAVRFSRFTRATLNWVDPLEQAEELVERLVDFARRQPEPPVLFYHSDESLLFVSRYRDRLSPAIRFVVADSELVEALVDKGRFQTIVERFSLPVPPMRRLCLHASAEVCDLSLDYPVVLKPTMRQIMTSWRSISGSKAYYIESPEALSALWPRLCAAEGIEFLVQEFVAGPETCIESYHVYVDMQGEIVVEFTGKKLRTFPVELGHSTALVITDAADVAATGRELVKRLSLRGVAKFDFKRGPDDRLHLLEINPRFNLWHHLAAIAGVNVPALVYADMAGLPRPALSGPRVGVRWCRPLQDSMAARAWGMSPVKWLFWALSCEAKSGVALDDPMPILAGTLHKLRQLKKNSGNKGVIKRGGYTSALRSDSRP